MTVQTSSNVATGIGNGVTTVFPVGYKFNEGSDLVVLRIDDATSAVETLTLNSDYTVQGAGNEAGGSVTMAAPLAIGKTLTITRIVDILQLTDLRNQGKFFAEVHEDSFDRFIMIMQQLFQAVGDSLQLNAARNRWDAKGRRIINVGDPVDAQDAVTKSWLESYIAALLQTSIGPVQSAASILYVSPGGSVVTVQDLSNKSAGSPGAGHIGINGETVSDALSRKAPYRESSEVDVLLVYGQSNARGYAANSDGDPLYKVPLARVWDGAAFVEITSYTPTANDGTSTGSAWLAFANEYCTQTGRQLVVLNCAKGSQSISDLQKGGVNYTALDGWVTGALSAIVAEGNTVGKRLVAFNQGERDSQLGTAPVTYNSAIAQLWADLKADYSFSAMGIFTVGYYATSDLIKGQVIQQAQRLFARDNEDVFIAYDHLGGFGSHNKLKVDGVHYNQRGYNIMGREGAKRFVSQVFPDTAAPASDQLIDRFGGLCFNQSQAWNYHGGVIRKASAGSWVVNHTSPNASSLIVSATPLSDRLQVKIANPARTVLAFNANFGNALVERGFRAAVSSGLNAASQIAGVDADGYSYADVYFSVDLYMRINMAAGTYDVDAMGVTLSNVLAGITVTFPGTGRCDIVHPATRGLAVGAIKGSVGRTIRSNSGTTTTIMQVRDAADALVNDEIIVHLPNMIVSPAMIPDTSDLSLQVIAADYAIW